MLSTNDLVVQSFVAHSMVLAIKVLAMGVLTAKQRFTKRVFSNPEDTALKRGSVVKFDDPDVERVRRAHLNDIENIPVFWVVGACYVMTNPSVAFSILLFRLYTAGRLLHTLVYAVKPMPQPIRGIVFELSNIICIYMSIRVLMHCYHLL